MGKNRNLITGAVGRRIVHDDACISQHWLQYGCWFVITVKNILIKILYSSVPHKIYTVVINEN
jgi:hypothetical protein